MTLGAAYYIETEGAERDSYNWVPESSRRARGFAVYAALRSLGRTGIAGLIDRCCDLTVRMADLDEVSVRIAEVATQLDAVVDWRGQKLGSLGAPVFRDLLDAGDTDIL